MQTFSDMLGQVFRAIMANKLRSFLTMFGIAWGVGSLLVLVGLGEGFRSGQHRQLATFGNDLVMMWNGTIPALANQHTGMRPYQLTLGDEAAMRQLPQIRAVTGYLNRNDLYQVSAYANTSGQVLGVEPNYSEVRFVPMAEGRFIDDADHGRAPARGGARLEERYAAVSRPTRCWAKPSPSTTLRLRWWAAWSPSAAATTTATTRRSTFRSPHAGTVRHEGRQRGPRCVELDSISADDEGRRHGGGGGGASRDCRAPRLRSQR